MSVGPRGRSGTWAPRSSRLTDEAAARSGEGVALTVASCVAAGNRRCSTHGFGNAGTASASDPTHAPGGSASRNGCASPTRDLRSCRRRRRSRHLRSPARHAALTFDARKGSFGLMAALATLQKRGGVSSRSLLAVGLTPYGVPQSRQTHGVAGQYPARPDPLLSSKKEQPTDPEWSLSVGLVRQPDRQPTGSATARKRSMVDPN